MTVIGLIAIYLNVKKMNKISHMLLLNSVCKELINQNNIAKENDKGRANDIDLI